jgi:hypothetical protein
MPAGDHEIQGFNPEHVMDEWRRLYDWAVLSRKSTAFIEEVSLLGQQYSSILNTYRQTTAPRRRTQLHQELKVAFDAMQALYNGLTDRERVSLSWCDEPF